MGGWEDEAVRRIRQSQKLQHVRYDGRGPILVEAQRLEAEGHRILKLNICNPAPFGFEAPDAIVADIVRHLPDAQGYSDSQGIYEARTAVAHYYQEHGLRDVSVDDVFIGNGVSELISMVLQAFVDDGNEILVPAPDYPLWTGAVTLAGGTPVHYLCDEENDWNPDLADIESKITENTHALVVINPNNPPGAVYSTQTVDDRGGGYRAGWVMISGPKELATDFLEGLTLIANMRMCANVPAQHAIQTALGGYPSIEDLIGPDGRFHEPTTLC